MAVPSTGMQNGASSQGAAPGSANVPNSPEGLAGPAGAGPEKTESSSSRPLPDEMVLLAAGDGGRKSAVGVVCVDLTRESEGEMASGDTLTAGDTVTAGRSSIRLKGTTRMEVRGRLRTVSACCAAQLCTCGELLAEHSIKRQRLDKEGQPGGAAGSGISGTRAASTEKLVQDHSGSEQVPECCTVTLASPGQLASPSPPRQTLRISASRAAAAAGIHPFADVGELFLDFLYQDLPELLLEDAAVVGIDVVSPALERARLLAKSGASQAFEAILQKAAVALGVDGIQAACEAIAATVAAAEQASRLTEEEAQELRSLLETEVRLGFGARHEDSALAAYEKRVGQPVYGQQQRIFVEMPPPDDSWFCPFPPPRSLTSGCGSYCNKLQEGRPAITLKEDETVLGAATLLGASEGRHPAYFNLTGFVDGLVDLPATAVEGKETVVVEVKHRMGRIKDPPDVYDVVQLCTYCRALGCTRGDLVQCLRSSSVGDGSPGVLHVTQFDFSEGSPDRKGWEEHVLPGLYAFVAAVYAARQDASIRYRLLAAATPADRAELAAELCPHLGR